MSHTVPIHRFANVAGVVVAGVLVLASCGDDGSDDAAPTTPPTEPAATTETAATPESTDAPAAETTEPAVEEPAATVPPNGVVVDVRALDNTFRPEEIEISAGTEVRWENGGRNDHNVLPADDELDWGVESDDFTPGDEYSVVFDTPGTYPYYCSLHGTVDFGMIGTVVVTG